MNRDKKKTAKSKTEKTPSDYQSGKSAEATAPLQTKKNRANGKSKS